MVRTSLPNATLTLSQLQNHYPEVRFVAGTTFMWSPAEAIIYYQPDRMAKTAGQWSLLHELGHAHNQHRSFELDIELIRLEVEAWQTAKQLARHHGLQIDEDHIQDCLDSYRDWLHRRSSCPECRMVNPQAKAGRYHCFNCGTDWKVSPSQLCHGRRRI